MKTPQKFNYTKEWFIENYTNTDKSLTDIALLAGCSYKIAQKWLHKFNIPAKPRMRKALNNLIRYKNGDIPWNKGLDMRDNRLRSAVLKSAKIRVELGSNRGEKHYNWKGGQVSYKRMHTWVNRWKGKAKICVNCGATMHIDWANISGLYKRDLDDYKSLCKSCHKKYDNIRKGVKT